MAVALLALDAVVQTQSAGGKRSIPIGDFHRLPGTTPQIDTVLQHGELITSVDLPVRPFAATSTYLKIRDRTSYAFALVSVAAALEITNGVIHSARIALGGVAHKPWRAQAAEQVLVGKSVSRQVFEQAASAAVQGAQPRSGNAFKVTLVQRAIVRVLNTLGGIK
jgi:xanthine dehydrogenase YagS FAD-binding subunit